MTDEEQDPGLYETIKGILNQLSLMKVLDEVEKRLRSKTRKAAGKVALTLVGLSFVIISVVFVSISLVRAFSMILHPAVSWALVGLALALIGMIILLWARLVTE
jgi:hypothetical protein